MISEFIGEFLFHPCAVEISGNTCSHDCCYCFANIRKTARYSNLTAVFNKLKRVSEKTYLDSLLNAGFPICLSNRTDPFSKNNYIHTLSILKYWMPRKMGMFIQTKTGPGIDEALEIIGDRRDVVWYITITSLDETINKRTEPGAPTTAERLKEAKRLHDLGFLVIIAFNPLMEEWMPFDDLKAIVKILKRIGIKNTIIEPLHFNKKEIETFSQNRRSRFSDAVLDLSVSKNKFIYTRQARFYIIDQGLECFKLGMPAGTEIFNNIRAKLGKIFPNIWDVINACFKEDYKNGYVLTAEKYLYELTKYDPQFFARPRKAMSSTYILRYHFAGWKGNREVQGIDNLNDIFLYHLNHKQCRTSLQNNALFRVIQEHQMNKLDSNGNVQLYFDGEVHYDKRTIDIKEVIL